MRLSVFCGALVAVCLSTGVAAASSFSFTGTFTDDDQLEIFQFTAPSASFTAETWSYAGGTNAASQPIASGGFDPVLSLFDATGGLVASSPFVSSNDDGAGVATDPSTGLALDSLLSINSLNAGHTYALVLSEYDNLANQPTYGDGFSEAGNSDFTASLFPCGGTAFCDQGLNQRDGTWAVDITGVGTAVDTSASGVPEPGSISLLAVGIAGLALMGRRLRRA